MFFLNLKDQTLSRLVSSPVSPSTLVKIGFPTMKIQNYIKNIILLWQSKISNHSHQSASALTFMTFFDNSTPTCFISGFQMILLRHIMTATSTSVSPCCCKNQSAEWNSTWIIFQWCKNKKKERLTVLVTLLNVILNTYQDNSGSEPWLLVYLLT